MLTLGLIPMDDFLGALNAGALVTHTLKESAGMSMITTIAQYFALFAIITSFLGVALSFVDFLSDGCKIKKEGSGTLIICLMTFVPPLLFAIAYPHVFETALQYAGGFGAVILFGVLPSLMVWRGRDKHPMHKPLVPGGKATLIAVMAFAWLIFGVQLYQAFYR
jgi:tyrosine-specific transport protein